MFKSLSPVLVAASLVSSHTQAAQYADSVISYSPGAGFATEFGTGLGYTNASVALGEPARSNPGAFGGPIDPFNPPYLKEQLVSMGTGGSLTVAFPSAIANRADNPFGIDFMIYGNAGFVITNGDFSGGGITDGSLLGANSGSTRVWVSADNLNFFQLDPSRAPVLDGFFPTDASGSFDLPADPSLSGSNFAGANLADMRSLYAGSAGGTGFDLAWAQDANGQSVVLPEVRFVRVDVLSGAAEIDGFAALVPEPGPVTLLALAAAWVLVRGARLKHVQRRGTAAL
jgi:hypothetical protein